MAFPPVVVADADVLFGATTRGLLIQLDYAGLLHLHWSPLILDEMSRALVKSGRKPDIASAKAHEALMDLSLPNAMVDVSTVQAQYEVVSNAVRSAKDTHVAACAYALLAIKAYPGRKAINLVSKNTKDFKIHQLEQLGVLVQRPDRFLSDMFDKNPAGIAAAFAALRGSLKSSPTPERLLDKVTEDGQRNFAAAMLAANQGGTIAL